MSSNKPRGRPFAPGNPGRPQGSRNKATLMIEQLAEGEAEELVKKVIELARGGDVACLRMVLDRIWPVPKGRPLKLEMPPIQSSEDVLDGHQYIWQAINEGRLSAEEAGALALVLERSVQAIDKQDLRKRVEALEQMESPDEHEETD